MGSKAVQRYGTRGWVPQIEADFTRGIVRDIARANLPPGTVYDATDYLLHQPGVAQKRGGTAYAGPALTGATFVTSVIASPFAAGEVLAIGENSHLYKVTAGATTDIGAIAGTPFVYDRMNVSPAGTYVTIAGATVQKYNGAALSALDTAFAGALLGTYKARLVAISAGRILFSPVPDVNAAWDTTNSWIDCDHKPFGVAALNNALLVFSQEGMERIIGATPPPNSDMDRAPITPIGCTDTRSIVATGPFVFFANPESVYLTNGSQPVSLTDEGGIGTYWRSLFGSYVVPSQVPSATSWTIAAGWYRGFLFVTVLDDSRVLQSALMSHVRSRAWWRLANFKAMCFTTSLDGRELYYGDAATNRVVKVSGIFSPASGNKNDADGTAVTPTIELRPVGEGTAPKSFGFGRLNYDMRDAASDNPTMAVTVKTGLEADTTATPAESPLVETTTLDRKRFTINKESQQVTVALAQTNASSKTELYAVEVETRPHPLANDGV